MLDYADDWHHNDRHIGERGDLSFISRCCREDAMEFRIADTCSDSLARLTGQEQKAVVFFNNFSGYVANMFGVTS